MRLERGVAIVCDAGAARVNEQGNRHIERDGQKGVGFE